MSRTATSRPRLRVLLPLTATAALLASGCAAPGPAASSSATPSSSASSAAAESSSSPTVSTGPASSSDASSSAAAASSSADASATTSSSSAADLAASSPAAGGASVENPLEPLLLLATAAPQEVFSSRTVQSGADQPLTMSLTLTGVTPTGRCRELVDEINATHEPMDVASLATYQVNPASPAVVDQETGAFTMIGTSTAPADLMAPYGELVSACGTLEGEQGQKAEFTAVPGVPDAATVTMTMPGQSRKLVMTVGGASEGRDHVYMLMLGLDADVSQQVLADQVAAFQER